jgi:RNA polymerase sigma-70 factor, ECF subfamily
MESAYDLLAELVRTERFRLASIARAEGLRPEEALDCTHEAFCTFLRLANEGRVPEDGLPAYVATLVRNEARNRRRRHHRARPHELHDDDAIDPASTQEHADTLLARAEEHVRLRACVDRLCETQKAVVTMRLLEEHGGEDVAARLGITRGHVDVLLHRAKANLATCMLEAG